jgi:peptide/nickel transport system permease protein
MVVTFAFVVLRLSGDPAQIIMGADAPPEAVEAFRAAWGLDEPILVQYVLLLRRDTAGRPRPLDARRAGRDRAGGGAHPGHPALTIPALLIKVLLGIPAGSMRRCTATRSPTAS